MNQHRTLPQARNTFAFVGWVRDCLFLDHGITPKRAWHMALHGVREFIRENGIDKIPHPAWDFSRPAAQEICNEYILRDG